MDIQFQEMEIPKNESSSFKIPQTIKRSAQKVSSLQGPWNLFKKLCQKPRYTIWKWTSWSPPKNPSVTQWES